MNLSTLLQQCKEIRPDVYRVVAELYDEGETCYRAYFPFGQEEFGDTVEQLLQNLRDTVAMEAA